MILVTGATGQLGKTVVNQLLAKTSASNIAILARDANKAAEFKAKGVDVRIGEFDNIASLQQATKGIDTVLLISGVGATRLEQHKNVIDAAKNNGVKRIAYTSVSMQNLETSANKLFMQSHFQTEDYIKESGLAYTIFRNTLYTDTILMFAGDKAIDTGIFLPAGNGKVSFALRREIGEAIAYDLLANYTENKTYDITGANAYSYADVADELAKLAGKQVAYIDADADAYAQQLKQFNLPDGLIQMLSAFAADIKNNQHSKVYADLENLLGRKPIDFSTALKELYNI